MQRYLFIDRRDPDYIEPNSSDEELADMKAEYDEEEREERKIEQWK